MKTSMSWAKWRIKVTFNSTGKQGTVVYHKTKKDAVESLNRFMKKDEFFDLWYDENGNIYSVEKA